ncbi:hypothetical protein AB4Z18_05570 [Leifsonia sp. 2TAF2]|uniref:hypothetical protein n=1 Tax=Leifsonia sp. 2TAF2 TaxID=3233009 RepID=UPI003F9798B0
MIDAATHASAQHSKAADASRAWAGAMAELQGGADEACRAAEEAEEDIAAAQEQLDVFGPEHAALLTALTALEKIYKQYANVPPPPGIHVPALSEITAARRQEAKADDLQTSARRHLEDAQERLEDAKKKAREAKHEYDAEAKTFAHRLEATLHGAINRATDPALNEDFVPVLAALTAYDPVASALTRGTVRPASIAVPGAGASTQQIIQWLVTGAFTASELIAACGPVAVMVALAVIAVGGVGTGSTSGSRFLTPQEQLERARLAMYYWTHNLDGTLKQYVGPAPTELGKYLNEGPNFDDVNDIVNGKTRPGKSEPHREVDTPDELVDVYKDITRGGKPTETPESYDGTRVELPDGTKIGLRNKSRSGGPAIDIEPPPGANLKDKSIKVHLPKGYGK